MPRKGPLLYSALISLDQHDLSMTVKEFICKDGPWDLNNLEQLLLRPLCEDISLLNPPKDDAGEDYVIWKGTNDGIFSAKSAYSIRAYNSLPPY